MSDRPEGALIPHGGKQVVFNRKIRSGESSFTPVGCVTPRKGPRFTAGRPGGGRGPFLLLSDLVSEQKGHNVRTSRQEELREESPVSGVRCADTVWWIRSVSTPADEADGVIMEPLRGVAVSRRRRLALIPARSLARHRRRPRVTRLCP